MVWEQVAGSAGVLQTNCFTLRWAPLRRSSVKKENHNLLYELHRKSKRIRSKRSRQTVPEKPIYPVNEALRGYLKHHGREVKLPVAYKDLLNFTYSVPLKDKSGKDTLWEKVLYDMRDWEFIREGLVKIYAILKTEGDLSFSKHLDFLTVSAKDLVLSVVSRILVRFSLDLDFGSWFS